MRVHNRLGALLLAAASLLSLAGCSGSSVTAGGTADVWDSGAHGKTTTYHLQVIEPVEVGRSATISAEISYQLVKSVKNGTQECRLKELLVKRNQRVEAGQVIAVLQGTGSLADAEVKQLEMDAYASGVEEQLAWYDAAIREAEVLPQQTARQREQRSLKIEYAQLEYEKYRLQAENMLKAMQAQLDALKEAAGEVVIVSPVSGTVRSTSLNLEEGSLISPGMELCKISGDEGLCLCGTVSGSSFVYGREITVTTSKGKNETSYTGRVISSPEVCPAGSGSLILMELDVEPEDYPQRESSAEVTYTVLSGVYAVPKNCITTRDGQSYVNVLIGDAVRTRAVAKGPMCGGMVTILHGLHEGDQVVLSSYNS